ncbi:MAG TPA: T9SS type A sorting domain-containing protein, partial [Lentimicrobium sp.]|nr:T9SS type A sorting domain-containing protein [Lentimicrobium sp.]
GSFNSNMALARFKADTATILVGTTLDFFDQSTGNPSLWNWYFEGGEPRTSNMQHPKGVAYNQTGLFDVKLKVTNAFGADSLLRENYIKVVPRIYPNPTQGEFFVMMGDESDESTRISIADTQGRIVYESPAGVPAQPFYRLNMSALKAGFYLVTIQNRFFTESARLLLVH